MAPRKRVSKIVSRDTKTIVEINDNNTRSISTQTDPLKHGMLRAVTQKRRLNRPQTEQQAAAKGGAAANGLNPSIFICPDMNGFGDEQEKRNKSTQTLKTALGPTAVNQSLAIGGQMDNLKALMKKRRADAIDWDREHLDELMEKINSDPPPTWHSATQMWLEVDKLEQKIEAYDANELREQVKEEEKNKNNNNNNNNKNNNN